MSEMIERVARAICLEQGYDPDADDNVIGGPVGARNWYLYIKHARVAIAAALSHLCAAKDAELAARLRAIELQNARIEILEDALQYYAARTGGNIALVALEGCSKGTENSELLLEITI